MASHHWQSAIVGEISQITGTRDPLRAVQQLAQTLLDDAEVAVPPVNLHFIVSFQNI